MTNIFWLALHETTEEIKECWETEERWGGDSLRKESL